MASTETARRLLQAADTAADEAHRLVADLIKFPTVNARDTQEQIDTCRREVKRCYAFLADWAKAHGFAFRNYDDLVAVIEQPGTSKEDIGFALHIDVVPVPGNWTHGPFSGDIADGCIWGRGAQDDKGPTAQAMMALKLVKEAGIPFQRGVRLIIGSTEETSLWECMERFKVEEEEPTFTVVPDAEYPIINGEKGFVTLWCKGSWGAEPAATRGGLRLVSVEGGDVENIVPDTCKVTMEGPAEAAADLATVLPIFAHGVARTVMLDAEALKSGQTRYVVTIRGKAAHSSLPELGLNAAHDGLALALTLFGPSHPMLQVARWLRTASHDTSGKGLGIAADHHFVGATTACLTILRLRATGVEAAINVRFTMGQNSAEVVELATRSARAAGLKELSITPFKNPREPIFVDPAQFPAFIGALTESYRDVTGRPAATHAIGGTTYAKAIARAVCFGPVDPQDGEPSLAHQADERVKLDHNLRNLKIYTLALARLVSGNSAL